MILSVCLIELHQWVKSYYNEGDQEFQEDSIFETKWHLYHGGLYGSSLSRWQFPKFSWHRRILQLKFIMPKKVLCGRYIWPLQLVATSSWEILGYWRITCAGTFSHIILFKFLYLSVEPVEHNPSLVKLYTEMVKPYCKQSLVLITEECISRSERSGDLNELHVLAKVSASSTCICTPC